RHTRFSRDWSSDVCSSDLPCAPTLKYPLRKHSTVPTPTSMSGRLQRRVLMSEPGPVMAPCTKPDIASTAEYPESWKMMAQATIEIGRASCRGRVEVAGGAG